MKYYAKFLLLAVGFSIILYGLRSYMSADGLSIQHYIVYNHCGELIKFTTAEMVLRIRNLLPYYTYAIIFSTYIYRHFCYSSVYIFSRCQKRGWWFRGEAVKLLGYTVIFAAVLPMWLLKQPRDAMTTYMFIGMIAGAVVGLLVAHPTMNLPVFTGFHNDQLGDLFPILFVTVACGAVSGFHSLVSSGTSSKTVSNEKDMLKVGYGAMVLESLLAVIALCVAGAAASANGTPADGTPFQVFSSGVAGFFEMFGIPVYVAQCFMTMCVSALALTSLDAVARIGRMSFQELFSVDDMEHAEGWRKVLCNTYFSTIITLAAAFVLTRIGYANIWPLFGSANQLLSALVLVTLCVFLKVTGRSNKMLFPPLIIMLCVTGTALVERTISLVQAFSAGSATFLVEGLQLIIAILLMILGVIIVVNSLRAYFASKKNSEI